MQKITPFLWFDNNAEEAIAFYGAVFKDLKVNRTVRYPEGSPGPAGEVMTLEFELFGQNFIALNGGPHFSLDGGVSFVVHCDTQEEVDGYWDQLAAEGKPIQCGWIKDKYGLPWQIVPKILDEYLADEDPAKAQRVMHAMLQMVKIDIPTLEAAYNQ